MISPEKHKELLFPFETVRKTQGDMLIQVEKAAEQGRCLIVHAPTGIGKTISALGPALAAARKKKLTVFFLTSRHTQHQIAIEMLTAIKKKYQVSARTADIIGKQHMCLQLGTEGLRSRDFREFCKSLRAEGKCPFYTATRDKGGKKTPKASQVEDILSQQGPCSTHDIMVESKKGGLCPYEMATMLCQGAEVIIADYNYIFNKDIRQNLFEKAELNLDSCILIIDEGHNLPQRMRELASVRLTSIMIDRALGEAKKNHFEDALVHLNQIQTALAKLSETANPESPVGKERFVELAAGTLGKYEELVEDLEFIAETVRAKAKQSYIGSIASFLSSWKGPEKGFARIISKDRLRGQPFMMLSYRCLDPSLVTKEAITETRSAIIMSGTLQPTEMYGDILGFPENTLYREYESPFPEYNRLSLIVPKGTTKYSMRTPEQYDTLAAIVLDISETIPGNVLVFFPSYSILGEIHNRIATTCKKTLFKERQGLTKDEKHEMLERFKAYSATGAILLAVASANYAEGIDLPGDLLKGVIVVGLPLQKPDLETKKLIEYYDELFQRGWDYGYVFPAFNKTLQNAGRCIRSETDKGVIVFLDERYAWPSYRRYFPPDQMIKVTQNYKSEIQDFFKSHS